MISNFLEILYIVVYYKIIRLTTINYAATMSIINYLLYQ